MQDFKASILYIEDDEGLARLLERRLRRQGYSLEWVTNGQAGLERIEEQAYDVAAIDYELPGMNGLTILERMQVMPNAPPAVMISGAGDMQTAISAMKMGAADYVVKTVDGNYLDLLPGIIDRILDNRRLQQQAQAIQRELEEERNLAAAVFHTSADPMLIIDAQTHISRCNGAFEALFGYTPDEMVGRPLDAIASEHHDAAFFEALWQAVARKGYWRGPLWTRHKDGSLLAEQMTVSAITGASGQVGHYVAVYSDMTEQMRREERVRHQAYHDVLTGLANRHLLMDRLKQAIEAAKRDDQGFALMFIDLDGFKPVNDNYGHRTGDEVLKALTRRLTERCRCSDTVARYGGDEFVVLLRNTVDRDIAAALAREFIDRLGQPVSVVGTEHQVGASLGIAFFPESAQNATDLLKAADEAMYRAKDAGKACFRFATPGP
ncbi:diguanylate cyclase [Marinobacter halodurans]|uniref:Diguanylate cyclase n=1 Tax=Marinobacter halodurans TaxID=2528979 RepID=A0ABY1ZQ36_9GAMM|nr:diguanylate cyclase [Marinobacter halodurans]TBW57594.1 diguanylate cyclase [Marinobacter halodurans]